MGFATKKCFFGMETTGESDRLAFHILLLAYFEKLPEQGDHSSDALHLWQGHSSIHDQDWRRLLLGESLMSIFTGSLGG